MPEKIKICGIYAVTHIETGRRYIGKSCYVQSRWREHIRECRNYNNRFYNALAKYGKHAFTWEMIEECARDALNEREKYWIIHFDTIRTGLNLTAGGEGIMPGFKHSAEERAAKSARQRGKPHSAEHNRRVSEGLTGRIVSEAILGQLRARAAAMRGIRRTFSEQHCKNIAASKIGRKMSPSAHKKMWETRRAREIGV